jgi:hypothetical protein
MRFKRSTTGGATWPAAPTVIDKPGQFADNSDPADLLPNKNARIPLSPSLAFNESSKKLGYVYQNNINSASSGADITFQASSDYGATWSDIQYVSVKGNGTPASNDQFFPWIQPDPEKGGWHVIFYDNRNDPGNTLIETFMAESKQGGWQNEDISQVAWNPNLSFFASGSFIGDYNGLAVAPKDFEYPVWADGRNTPGPPKGQTDIFTVPN